MNGRIFSDLVRSPEWRSAAEEWIDEMLAANGRNRAGPSEQCRVRSWSTQLLTPSTDGLVWFKANCPGLAHEAALQAELARLLPDRFDAPLGIDAERGWLLTQDHGPTLLERHEPTLSEWRDLAGEAAQLQRRLVDAAEALLATGLPDCSPPTVPDRFDELLDRLAALEPTHPSHLDGDRRRELETGRPRLVDAVAALVDGPLPVSLNHGDLHPNNVLLVDGSLRLFDLGDAQWSAAPEVLWAMWSWLTHRTQHGPKPVFAAYAEVWSDIVDRREFERLRRAAFVTLSVNRALTWWDSVAGANAAELTEWGNAPLSQLQHVLDELS